MAQNQYHHVNCETIYIVFGEDNMRKEIDQLATIIQNSLALTHTVIPLFVRSYSKRQI